MRNIFTSCALCALGLAVTAQGALAAQVPTVQHDKGAGWIHTVSAAPGDAEPGQGTHSTAMRVAADSAPEVQPAADASTARHKQDRAPEHEHRPAGATMLIAAVALMSAIALRRLGAGYR